MPAIVERLKRQLAAKHIKNAEGMAFALMHKAGIIDKNNKLTAKGKKRQALGKAGRAKDRAAKYSGNKSSDYKYNPKTNRVKKK